MPFGRLIFRIYAIQRMLERNVVAADNAVENETVVITVYEPEPTQWDQAFERRKKK